MPNSPPGPNEDPPKAPRDYAHMVDEETQRTRWELWLVIAIVVVVVGGGLVWRATTGHHATRQIGWSPSGPGAKAFLPAAGSLPDRGAPAAPQSAP